MVLPYVSSCIRCVVFMCVCVCVCVCSDVLKNCTVPFAQRIHRCVNQYEGTFTHSIWCRQKET